LSIWAKHSKLRVNFTFNNIENRLYKIVKYIALLKATSPQGRDTSAASGG
jgi:hypothetical protein